MQTSGVDGQMMSYLLNGVTFCYIEQILIFFIESVLDNLNSNLLFNLSEGFITVESACFTCIITCLSILVSCIIL